MHGETPVGDKILGTIIDCGIIACPEQEILARNSLRLIREYGLEPAPCQRIEDSNFDTTRCKLLKFRGRARSDV